MKKTLVLLFLLPLFIVGCSNDPIKQQLKDYVTDRSELENVKYKLISYEFKDTITVGNMIDSITLSFMGALEDPDLEKFTEYRNQEFKKFRDYDKKYEEKVMRGELKDASPWCTEIREVTEKADSLIANWDKVTKYSYDYNYLYWWYLKRQANFYDFSYSLKSDIEEIFDLVSKSKDKFDLLNELKDEDKDKVYQYKVIHKYSIYNPLFKARVGFTDAVYFNDKLEYIRYDDSDSDLFDFIK